MRNELLLILSVVLIYGTVLLSYRLFGKTGLYAMTVISTLLANIEVLLVVRAFGIEQTLGNVMFASTYLICDLLSENEGKKSASKAVALGVFTSVAMLVFTRLWLLYTPSSADWAGEHINALFSFTPRLLLGSFLGYALSQACNVWLYHRLWDISTRKTGDRKRLLWFRNNLATLISQVVNTVVFTLAAFGGVYPKNMLLQIMLSSYIIYIFTSLLDTPAVYLGRYLKRKNLVTQEKNNDE